MLRKIVKKRVLLRILILSFVFATHYGFSVNFVNEISPRNSERSKRKRTDYIILHTTEAPEKSSLSSLKRYGEANYMVSPDGTVYRIIDHSREAYHCGLSMWNSRTNLDKVSIGIEVVGYHNKSITQSQYTALKSLISELQRMYRISDKNVLTHSMVAYGVPNKWHKYKHRGRKRCGMLFATDSVRYQLGLTDRYLYDPDVRAGRLNVADHYLHSILYKQNTPILQTSSIANIDELNRQYDTYVIPKGKSPWDTVGLNSKLPGTLYIFPDGKRCFARDIDNWSKIPAGTKILVKKGLTGNNKQLVNAEKVVAAKQENKSVNTGSPRNLMLFNVFYETNIVVKGKSPWDMVGHKCKSDGTVYVFPDGKNFAAQDIKNWSNIPVGTKILVPQKTGNIDISKSYVFTEALSGNSVVLSQKDVLSANNLFLLSGGVQQGSHISIKDLEQLKPETKVLIGYEQKGILGGEKSAFDLVSSLWNRNDTIYYLPNKNIIITGDKIDERSMLKGTHLLLKK